MLIALAFGAGLPMQIPPPPPPPGVTQAPPPLHYGEQQIVCPIGGETVRTTTLTMFSTFGERPDGKPFSEVSFPVPMPVCPGNGLVVLPNLSATEVDALRPIVASAAYRSLVRTESPFYRAYWLAVKLQRPAADVVDYLLPAIWEAKERDQGDTRRPNTVRYQRALIEATKRFGAEMSIDDRAYFWFESANALREMGRFDDAERVRRRATAVLPRLTRAPLKAMIADLGQVIARRDQSDEPLDMIPVAQATMTCRRHPPTDALGQRFCKGHPSSV